MSVPVKAGRPAQTLTFGTLLCSADPDADIEIDDVRYDVVPKLMTLWDADHPRSPSIGTWFRSVPTIADGGKDATPIISFRGGPQQLVGEVRELGEGLPSPIDRECDGYAKDDRSWPVVELLTVMTVGHPGAVARHTYVDYHVDDEDYTLTISWQVGICGPAVPRELECPRR